ncbi:MAG: histidine kinase, partial [Gemmatimonadaceae bacterium]
ATPPPGDARGEELRSSGGRAALDPASAEPLEEQARRLLGVQRERAERRLNAMRAAVLLLLGSAALVYAPSLTSALNRVNVLVLVPMMCWTLAQHLLFPRGRRLPGWLAVVNPLADITAVTAILGGYGLAQSPALALKTPVFLAYFAILAARPIASSTRKAAFVAGLAVLEYGALVACFVGAGQLVLISNPVAASTASAVSPLDEGAKLLLLAVAGAIATYATAWHERIATTYYRESWSREQLEVRLARAQLESLKLQLHPHFLFNTLNTITALITADPNAAERMVTGLSELLRLTLRNAGEQEVPLAHELELLEHYVDIQQIRFQDRLTVSFAVDPEARRALVPNFILQPLVENAIRHGIAPRATAGRVDITARSHSGVLQLEVTDDGVGLRVDGRTGDGRRARGGGIGLANTQARLQHLYGVEHQFQARAGASGGFAVRIDIPIRYPANEGGEERFG